MFENWPRELSVKSLDTVLYCGKWNECVSFYRDVLGFPVVFANDILVEVEPVTGARIGLMDAGRTRWPASRGDSFILSFRVSDIEETHQFLQKNYAGIGELKDHPWGARLFEIRDPEARRIEFWSDTNNRERKDMTKNLGSMEDLAAKALNLSDLAAYQEGSVVSREILKKKTGTVTLFAFDQGQGLSEHTAPFDALVYILDGEAEITVSGKPLRVQKGEMIIMPAHNPHALQAVKRFKMVLIMIRSEDKGS